MRTVFRLPLFACFACFAGSLPSHALEIANGPYSNLAATSCTVWGNVVSTNNDTNVTATLYWGTADGTNNAAAWTRTNAYGAVASTGNICTNLTGLALDVTYYYRWYMSGAVSNDWSDSTANFLTRGPTNLPAATARALMVNPTTGQILDPTNFVSGNSLGTSGDISSATGAVKTTWIDGMLATDLLHTAAIGTSAVQIASHALTLADNGSRLTAVEGVAEGAWDWSDINERRVAVLWRNQTANEYDLPGGFWLSCTNAVDFDASVSSNYVLSASGVAWEPLSMWNDSTGAVTQWRMDEAAWDGTPGEVVDSSGNGYHGVRGGDATTTTGQKLGTACGTFDGNDYVDAGLLPDIITGVTVCAWVKHTSGSNSKVLVKPYNESTWDYPYMCYALAVAAHAGAGISVGGTLKEEWGSATVNDGAWHHVSMTVDETSCLLYADGVQDGSFATGGTIDTNAFPVCIGRQGVAIAGEGLNGQLDDVRVYSRALSSNEVWSIYNGGAGRLSLSGSQGGNMLVRSTNAAWCLETYTQTQGRVCVFVQDPDHDTRINTDLTARVSWNGGANWDTVPLRSESLWPSDTMIYSASTNWSGPGTQGVLEVSVTTTNGCDGTINGMGVFSRE